MTAIPTVTFAGGVPISRSEQSKLLFTHESAPMREIIKATLCYSNNFLAERLGDMLGGPSAVARIAQQNIGANLPIFIFRHRAASASTV